jgi:hypothetical protein
MGRLACFGIERRFLPGMQMVVQTDCHASY